VSAAKSVRVRITGRVQGVWYRGWTVDRARELGLSGWVRNRRDGSVEAVLAGDEAAVDDMLARLREGPPAARVDDVAVEHAAPPEEAEFRQMPTT
jgi:acylphosphatase